MNDNCSQCKFLFHESSIQSNRRERNNLPILCQECYRLNMARGRAEKRSLLQNIPPKKEDVLENLTNIHGKLSPSLLMSKLKISYELAQELCLSKNQ